MSTTKTAKHTPGPWKNDGPTRQGGVRIVAQFKPRCTYVVAETLPGYPEEATSEANARLIAAAPDLLAACEEGLNAIDEELHAAGEEQVKKHPILRSHARTADKLRAAIAKARGQ